jgi:hypothetical protein
MARIRRGLATAVVWKQKVWVSQAGKVRIITGIEGSRVVELHVRVHTSRVREENAEHTDHEGEQHGGHQRDGVYGFWTEVQSAGVNASCDI